MKTLILALFLASSSLRAEPLDKAEVTRYALSKEKEWEAVAAALSVLEKSALDAKQDAHKNFALAVPAEIIPTLSKVGLITSETYVGWMENAEQFMIPNTLIQAITLAHQKKIALEKGKTIPLFLAQKDLWRLKTELAESKKEISHRRLVYAELAKR